MKLFTPILSIEDAILKESYYAKYIDKIETGNIEKGFVAKCPC